MNNAYPEKPMVPYRRTAVAMSAVIAYLQSLHVPAEVKRTAYVIFRNESANGRDGVCNNYAGVQADSARWPAKFDSAIVGVVKEAENGTGRVRLFAAFDSFKASVDFLVDRVAARGLYVGGITHLVVVMPVHDDDDLVRAYYKEWVTGSARAEPPPAAVTSFLSMYAQAVTLFPNDPAPVAAAAPEPDPVQPRPILAAADVA